MARKANGLAHTKRACRHHSVFSPKYRGKAIHSQYREDLGQLCQWRGVGIVEGHLMTNHVHMSVGISPRMGVSSFMGYLRGKSPLLMFGGHASLKYRFGSRKFWAESHYVSTAGLDEGVVAECIRGQERADIAPDRLSVKEHEDPFAEDCGESARAAGLTGPPRVKWPSGPNGVRAGDLSPWPQPQGYTLGTNNLLRGWS